MLTKINYKVLYVATFSIETINILDGGTKHLYYLNPEIITLLLKLTWISQPIGIMASAFGKCLVAFLLRRIIGPDGPWKKCFLYINIVLYMAVSIVANIIAFCQCQPADAIWTHSPNAKCWNLFVVANFDVFQSCENFILLNEMRTNHCVAYGVAFDFFLALLPISLI